MRQNAPQTMQRHQRQRLALAAFFVGLVGVLAVGLAWRRASILVEERAHLEQQAAFIEGSLARRVRATQRLLETVTDDARSGHFADPAQASALLRSLAEIHDGVRVIRVVDGSGRIVASSDAAEINDAVPTERGFLATARTSKRGALSLGMSALATTELPGLSATRALTDDRGAFIGAVHAALDPAALGSLLRTTAVDQDVWSALVHADGVVLTAFPGSFATAGANLNTKESLFERHLRSGGERSFMVGPFAWTADERMMALQTVRPRDIAFDHGLVIIVSRSVSAVLAPWVRLAATLAVLASVLLLVSAGGLWWAQREERRAAAELGETIDRLERIGQTVPGIICQFELRPDGHAAMPYATRPLEPTFGIPISAVPGSADPLFSFIDAEHVDAVRSGILDSARTQQPYRGEFRIHVPGQPPRWLDVHSVPQIREDGSTLWTGLVMDTTETRAARDAQTALEAAQQASRSKSEFLSRASHELRTPLNAVMGFSSLLLSHDREKLTPTQLEQIGYIYDAGHHLLALINDLLDVSSIESGHISAVIEDVSLSSLRSEVLSTVREQASSAGVELVLRKEAPRLAARADRLRLKQVVLNLLSNAIKYNRRGGTVTLVLAGSIDTGARIEVHDTGEGLSAEQCAHLFEPFNRLGADRRGIPGTGIGLTIAKMLVELMHGRLTVQSTPGEGSCFAVHVEASAVPAPPDSLPGAPPPLSIAARGALRVLYVEDDAMNALFVQKLLLLRPDLSLTVARSGAEALVLIDKERPDLVLLDLQLGDMSGFDLLAKLKAEPATAGLRCAAITADATSTTRVRAIGAGFFDYLTKPVDLQRLLQLVDAEVLFRGS